MSYSVSCECGQKTAVEASQAGLSVSCVSCQKKISVPRLSRLREAVGETPFPMTLAEEIRGMIKSGQLPVGDRCPVTAELADAVVFVHIRCDPNKANLGEASLVAGLFLAIGGWLGILLFAVGLMTKKDQRERVRTETELTVPLRVSSAAITKISRMRNYRLKSILRQTPIYAKLLSEFPEAITEVVPEPQ